MASAGYPSAPRTGDVVTGIDEADQVEGVTVLHAGTSIDDAGRLVTAGGRVLGVRAVGPDIATARARAYAAMGHIRIDGSHYRTDIAAAVGAR